MNSVAKVIKSFRNQLVAVYPTEEINSIIEIVFEHKLNYSKTDLLLKQDEKIPKNQKEELEIILSRLKNNEPVQYVLGETIFYDLNFGVAPSVLIPRQETEELVDWIINENSKKERLDILDIGTGSGCIAISLAANLKHAQVTAFDISEKALEIAKKNASKNKVSVDFLHKDILKQQFKYENKAFDIIVSNPPYVLNKERKLMQANVLDHEPGLALFVNDENPLLFYKAIINFAKLNLKEFGKLYFEINEAFGEELKSLMQENGFANVELRKDLNGKDRMIGGRL